jgi:hypothetical protein
MSWCASDGLQLHSCSGSVTVVLMHTLCRGTQSYAGLRKILVNDRQNAATVVSLNGIP